MHLKNMRVPLAYYYIWLSSALDSKYNKLRNWLWITKRRCTSQAQKSALIKLLGHVRIQWHPLPRQIDSDRFPTNPTDAIRKVEIVGTYTDLAEAKVAAKKAFFDLGYRADLFEEYLVKEGSSSWRWNLSPCSSLHWRGLHGQNRDNTQCPQHPTRSWY